MLGKICMDWKPVRSKLLQNRDPKRGQPVKAKSFALCSGKICWCVKDVNFTSEPLLIATLAMATPTGPFGRISRASCRQSLSKLIIHMLPHRTCKSKQALFPNQIPEGSADKQRHHHCFVRRNDWPESRFSKPKIILVWSSNFELQNKQWMK